MSRISFYDEATLQQQSAEVRFTPINSSKQKTHTCLPNIGIPTSWWLVARSPTGICLFISELDLLCAPISAQRRFVSCSIITIITFVVFVCLLACFAHISVYFTFDTMHKLLSILMLKINFSFDHIMTAVFQCVYII